jgi:hypothetical protein
MTAYVSGGIIEPSIRSPPRMVRRTLRASPSTSTGTVSGSPPKTSPSRDLTRNDHDDWTLAAAVISPYTDGPTITSSSTSAAGAARDDLRRDEGLADGTESALGNLVKLDNIVNYPVTEGSVSVLWTAETDAFTTTCIARSSVLLRCCPSVPSFGYVGRTRGTKFTDPNIIPDFGRVPPL